MKSNTPSMLQYEATECGAASLGIILGYYGKYLKLTELRKACGINRDGSNAIKIIKAAKNYGCEAKGYKFDLEGLFEQKPPFIIFWKFYHFLVVDGWNDSKTKIYINDPAEGKYTVNIDEFSNSYTGISLLIKPGKGFQKGGKLDNIWLKLFTPLESFPLTLIILTGIAILSVIPQLVIAGAASQFTNRFLTDGLAYFGMPIVWVSVIAVMVLATFTSINYIVLRRLQFVLSKRISTNLFIKLFSSSLNFFTQRSSGEVATRLLLGITLSSTLIGSVVSFMLTLISSILILIVTSFINIHLTLLTIAVIAFNITLSYAFTRVRKDENKKLSRQQGLVQGTGLVALNNIQMIKSCGLEVESLNNWMNVYTSFNYQQQVLGAQVAIMQTLAISSRFVLNVAILIIGGFQILDGNFTLGGLLAFQFLQPTLQAPIGGIASLGNTIQLVDGYFGRIDDLVDEPLDPNVTSMRTNVYKGKKDYDNTAEGIDVEIKNVSYSFGINTEKFIEDLTIKIKSGESLAICGPSGCGKSTLLKLIAGLYEQDEGEITYQGLRRSDFAYREFSKAVAYVPQDIFMFNTSFGNNISLWDPVITQERIEWAANLSQIADVIRSYPQSFSYNVGQSGGKLSGGQKQRVSIARALARNPELVLLDEATSALDNKTESKIIDDILTEGMTVISVSHRLYTALRSDNVLVMEKGKVIEYGPPDELLANKGLFANLVKAEQEAEK